MPKGRAIMTVAFVKNKLIFVGGYGDFASTDVDIYDIYTGNFNYTVV